MIRVPGNTITQPSLAAEDLKNRVRKNTPYQRRFDNDFGSVFPSLIKRLGMIALPFAALYQPFAKE